MSNSASRAPSARPRVLVCGWAGAGNIGDELLTRAVVDVLQEEGAQAVVASRDPGATKALHHGVEAVPWGVAGLRRMGHIDGVCVGPGGILQDSSSVWSLPAHLVLPWRARRRGAALAAVGVGAEPLRFRGSGWMLRRVLGGATIVTRDAESSAALRAVGLTPTTAADVVFGLVPPGVERQAEVVVSIGPSTKAGLFSPASRRLDPPPIEEAAAAIDAIASRIGCRVVLTRFRGPRDAKVAVEIGERLMVEHEILGDDVDEHVRRVTGARLVVSSRYHPIVLAAAAATPAIVISDQPKLVSLVAQIDHPSITRVSSWNEVDTAWDEVGAVPRASGPAGARVPAGLHAAHDALVSLVRAARGTRGDDPLG